MLQTICIIVQGKVQGVFFRQSTRDTALKLQITGEVKNLDNGDVEIIATGTHLQLEQLTDWCRQGPPRARVTGINVKNLPLQEFPHFKITRQ